jgi:hypothetical protein
MSPNLAQVQVAGRLESPLMVSLSGASGKLDFGAIPSLYLRYPIACTNITSLGDFGVAFRFSHGGGAQQSIYWFASFNGAFLGWVTRDWREFSNSFRIMRMLLQNVVLQIQSIPTPWAIDGAWLI